MVQHELAWFVEHVQQSSGLFFFKLVVWQEDNVGHSMLTIHIDASTWGLGIWFLLEKRGYQCLLPIQHPTDAIFFFKALTVCSAIHISVCFPGATHLLIATDNTNMFDVFALPITQSSSQWSTFSSDVTLTWELFTFQDHSITSLMDALLWYQNNLTRKFIPAIQIEQFTPSWDVLGTLKNWYWYLHHPGNLLGFLGC